jgi:hypothetical protein
MTVAEHPTHAPAPPVPHMIGGRERPSTHCIKFGGSKMAWA